MPVTGRHQFEHQVPTHIHDPEENMMVLARWTHRAMQNPTRFWGAILGIVVGLLALVLLATTFWSGLSRNAEVWSQLETVKSPADRVKIAEDFPDSPASSWARLEAASDYYHQGMDDLPNNRDVALPTLKKALDNFDEVAKSAPKDSPQARVAAMGKARTLEARGELTKAVEQYELVAKTWPGTVGRRARQASRGRAQESRCGNLLQGPLRLHAHQGDIASPGPAGLQHAPVPVTRSGSPTIPAEANPGGLIPSIPLLPPPPPSPAAKTESAPAKGKEAAPAPAAVPQPAPVLPASPFDSGGPAAKPQPAAAPAVKTETPKPAAKPSSQDGNAKTVRPVEGTELARGHRLRSDRPCPEFAERVVLACGPLPSRKLPRNSR